nr:nitrate regulatory gene2 protein [Ipomoea batatas]
MGCNGSKAVETELVIRCRERRDLIKAAADHRYYLAAAHLSYFHSLKDVGDALRRFVDEELVAASSSSPSSLSSPSLILPSGERKLRADGGEGGGKKRGDSSGSSGSVHHIGDGDGGEKESHLSLPSDSSDDEHFHLHETGYNGGHLHIDEEEGHTSPASPFQHPDLPMGSHGPYVTMNQEPPPQMGYWDPFYGYNPQLNPPFYGGNSNTYAYYMNKSSPTMKTVIHEAEAGSTAYSNAYWSSPYQNNAGDYFGYPPVGPYGGEGMRNRDKKPSPPAEPPPPPSPKASVWDFLNPFEAIEQQGDSSYFPHGGGYGYGSNSSSPDLKEVREREGIPDLEEETETELHMDEPKLKKKLNNEFKKKRAGEGPSSSSGVSLQRGGGIGGEQLPKRMPGRKIQNTEEPLATKPMHTKHSEGSSISKGPPSEDSGGSTIRLSSGHDECSLSDMTSSIDVSEEKASSSSIVSKSPEDSSVKTKGVTFEVDHEIESSKLSNSDNKPAHGTRDLREVVAEIKDEFEIASSYGREVAVMLEVGKLPYYHSFIRVLMSRILYSIVPSSSSLQTVSSHSVRLDSRTRKLTKSYFGDASPENNLKPCYLSSTLAQLYEWEKKLYKEVKEEEQLRLLYERQCRKLKVLDEQGKESSKIDAVQASIRKLLTKLNVSIKAIDSISNRIHKLRDEKLQPQVAELINGLIRMWRSMLNCHQKQFQAIMESKTRALKANIGVHADSTVRATLELELQLLAWCSHFNDWICTQKSYVESLNGWILRCLIYEPEETPDGPVPFSPGRLGAPPIFVICNDWNHAMETISETRVAMTMNNFASSLRKLWERQDEEHRQRLRAEYISKDYKRRLKMLKMEKGRTGHDRDAMSQKTGASMVPSENGVSPLDDLKVDLDTFRKKLVEEKVKHEDTLKLVHDAASSSLQGGLLPIFKALENFTLEAVKAHEQIRLQNI